MAAWERNTCIRFKKRTGERDYIKFINGGKGKYKASVLLTFAIFKGRDRHGHLLLTRLILRARNIIRKIFDWFLVATSKNTSCEFCHV